MKLNRILALALVVGLAASMVAIGGPVAQPVGAFKQVKLTSNAPGAPHRDKRMVNAWGIASLGGSDPFWINDAGSGVSELIDGQGKILKALPFVTIPGPAGCNNPSRPTGIVANNTQNFMLPDGSPALFVFDTLDGTIAGWNSGRNAVTVVDNSKSGASYTGLATATNAGNLFLYAANAAGSVDVFDSSFHRVTPSGSFTDPNVPSGLTPYGIANINGNLFVTFSRRVVTANGVIDEFDPDGNLVMRFASGGTLNQPWGMTLAPASFGAFSNDLLVGNFGDGAINAFNPTTGEFLGQLTDVHGHVLKIPGLWGLMVGEGVKGVTNPNAVYFTAGPNIERNGIFGFITTAPKKKRPRPSPTSMPTIGGYGGYGGGGIGGY